MIAYHFLRADSTAGYGDEPAWSIGERREIPRGTQIEKCEYGYHHSPSFFDCLRYAPGPLACIVEVRAPRTQIGDDKHVSRSRRLLAAVNVEKELRLFACDCAWRALEREREIGREPRAASWSAVEVARKYATGDASISELSAAESAARSAAWSAAESAEIEWQRERLHFYLAPLFPGYEVAK